MPTTEEQIQKTVVSLEVGRLARVIWRAVLVCVALCLSIFYLLQVFRGLPVSQSMDQAQIGRELLRGHGWATEFARPLAIGQLRRHGKDVQKALWIDTYNAPIPPLLDAAAIYIPVENGWTLQRGDLIYAGDRAIAIMEICFFLASLVVLYFIALDLFDRRLAMMAVGLALICDLMWRYSLSGLPQMFLLLLLHLSVYALLRAMRARYLSEPLWRWTLAIGAGFGLMALTHALTIFIFVPVLLFSIFFFRPRGRAALLMLAVFLLLYTPWLVRNAKVCGSFSGIAGMSVFDGIVHPESGHMRRFGLDLTGVSGNYYFANFRTNLVAQINRLVEYMGWSPVALIALVSVLHAFRRPVTAAFRWLLFAMWASTVCGMALYGLKDEGGIGANQLYVLFVPLFICYGMAYVLVQWDRRIGLAFILPQWGARSRVHYFLRHSMVIAIFFVSSIPLLTRLFLDRPSFTVEWPPYIPSYIAIMRNWFQPNEIIASDMPWAVAWYADRRSLWLPYERSDLMEMLDYNELGDPIAGLYFTPISGTENTLGDLVDGEYKNWTAYIVRTVDLTKTPFPVKTVLGMPNCVLYTDRDRRPPRLASPAAQ
jgi:hypothetical protein